jgi:hypothetical protein
LALELWPLSSDLEFEFGIMRRYEETFVQGGGVLSCRKLLGMMGEVPVSVSIARLRVLARRVDASMLSFDGNVV